MNVAHVLPDGSRPPQGSVLHGFLADEYPSYVERHRGGGESPVMAGDVEAFLTCGDIKRSSATLGCFECRVRRTIPLSCKCRSFCEPCGTRRQLDRGQFLQRNVFGATPVRLWTMTLPYPFRIALGVDLHLLTEILNVVIHRIMRHIRLAVKHAKGLKTVNRVHPGSVTVIQRTSSALDPNVHFHMAFTDGAFVRRVDDRPLEFVQLDAPSDVDLARIAWDVCRRVCKVLSRLDLWEDLHDAAPRVVSGLFTTHDDGEVTCRLTGVAAKQPVPKGVGAFNLDASCAIGRGDAENLLGLMEYLLAPAIRDDQLTRTKDGVILEFKRPRLDGSTHRQYRNEQLISRLEFLVPPPRANLVRFHGVYAPNSALRKEVVPIPAAENGDEPRSPHDNDEHLEDYLAWAELNSHAFPDDITRCPSCGGRMQLLALKSARIEYRRKPRPAAPP